MAFADLPDVSAAALLQRSLERNRLGHAYLFTGEQSGLLEELALALTQTLHCSQPPRQTSNGEPLDACNQCSDCRRIREANHPDVLTLRPDSKLRQIRLRQIIRRPESPPRILHDLVYTTATEGGWKIAILSAADCLNPQAANAFLKSLEEPPARTLFLLLSTDPGRLLDTIRSRCQHLHVGGASQPHGEGELAWASVFARQTAQAQGGLFSRYQLLGTLLDRLADLRAQIRESCEAASPLAQHDDPPPELVEQWDRELEASIEAEYRRQRAEHLTALQSWLRDVWLATCNLENLTLLPELSDATRAVAQRITPTDAERNLALLEQTQRTLRTTVQELLALEVGLLRLRL